MANPLFQALGGNQNGSGHPFVQFMNQMKGRDPNQMLNELVQSGKVTQAQLDQAQRQAQQMGGQMSQFKAMFGFR